MNLKQFSSAFYALLLMVIFTCSCRDEERKEQGFEITSLEKQEGDGSYTVRISTGTLKSSTIITIGIDGSAILEADFTLNVASTNTSSDGINFWSSSSSSSSANEKQITVSADQTYVDVPIKVIDDQFIEPESESIHLEIIEISDSEIDNAIQNRTCEIVINDNDTPPTNAMQVDLSWYTHNGSLFSTSDFDLYLVKNVVISKNQIVSKEVVADVYSTNKTTLESFTLSRSLPDGTYYALIRFVSGTADSAVEIIASEGNNYSHAASDIRVADVGRDFYYGPIVKSGSSFSGRKVAATLITPD